jgi:hypothetical protein
LNNRSKLEQSALAANTNTNTHTDIDTRVIGLECLRAASVCTLLLLSAGALSAESLTLPAHARTLSPPRYGIYLGLPTSVTPSEVLHQSGIEVQAGIQTRGWCTVGADFTRLTGAGSIAIGQIPKALRTPLQAEITGLEAAALLPPDYRFKIDGAASSMLFSFGPQFNTRAHRGVALLAHPDIGALREEIKPHPGDAFSRAVTQSFMPAGRKVDWTPFYGGGGGVDLQLSRHITFKSMIDVVYSHAFNDLLADGTWTYRFSSGVTFQFGSRRESR